MAISSHTKWLRFLNILFCVVILVLSGNAYTRICSPPNHIDRNINLEIIDNWKRLSIYNLASVGGVENCNFGYEEIRYSTKWAGSVSGCYCKSGGSLSEGSCSSNEKAAGCSEVSETNPFLMNSWRGRKLCILRAGTAVYWAPDPDSDSCPKKKDSNGNEIEFVKCGTGNAAVCQEKSLGCPVNRVQLVKSSEPKPADMSNFVFLGEDYVLYFGYANSSSTEGPIVDFAISEGQRCLQDPGDVNNDQKEYYKLVKSKPDECKYQDDRFVRVDSMNEVTFFQYNNLQNVSTLPGLVLDEKVNYYLSYRSSILWKTVCHKDYYSMKTLHENKRPFTYIYGLHLAVLIVETIFAAYLVIADPLMLYFCYKKAEEEINEYDQPIYTILLIEKFLKIILVPLVLTTCIVVAYYRNWFYNLGERCCSDPTTNACFGFVDYILDDLYGLDWANFSVIITVLIVDLISGLCLFVSRTKENFS